MDVGLPTAGGYVLAVSGGVDSVALLHLLNQANQNSGNPWKLTVAHLDHGIREDSLEDRLVVQEHAKQLRLPFVYQEAGLGPGASEAEARDARYKFLRGVQKASGSRAVVTAHHQDDVLETAILNILRGTGRKGMSSLSSQHALHRPLLHIPKNDLIAYAKDQGLNWREDSTNNNLDYLRNYIRHRIIPRLSNENRNQFLRHIEDVRFTNRQIDTLLVNQLHNQSVSGKIDRVWFNNLPHSVAREIMAAWLRSYDVRDFDKKAIERLVVAAKTGQSGKEFDILQGVRLVLTKHYLALVRLER